MAIYPINTISLCAGSGGLDLAIRIAEPAARAICYVEREASAGASLVASMEAGRLHTAPIWSDLTTFDAKQWRGCVDIVTSGDPCQPNSVAGNKAGKDDERFLIDHVLRIVEECRPFRLFRENVTGNADGQLAAIVPPLEAMGYRVAAGIFSSQETLNSHRRERLFIMADKSGERCRETRRDIKRPSEWIGGQGAELGHSNRAGLQGQLTKIDNQKRWQEQNGPVGLPGGAGVFHTIPKPNDPKWGNLIKSNPQYRPAVSKEEAQSLFHRGFDAVADRTERIRHCGNGVDPVAGAYAYLCLNSLQQRGATKHARKPV